MDFSGLRIVFLVILLLALPVAGQSEQGLPAQLTQTLKKYKLSGTGLSIYVQDLASTQPIIAYNADIPRNPASAIKTLTTAAGLSLLGPNYTWSTKVYALGKQQGDVLNGDLLIQGQGDPFFSVDDAWRLVRSVRTRGIRQIKGRLLLDDSYFAPINSDPGTFDGKPYHPYNALPSALLLNFNAIELLFRPEQGRVSIISTPAPTTLRLRNQLKLTRGACRKQHISMTTSAADSHTELLVQGRYPANCGISTLYRAVMPARQMFAGTFIDLWQQQGGSIKADFHAAVLPASAPQALYVHPSRPLAELLRGMNKYSNNVMTRQLFLTLGAERFGAPATLIKSRNTINQWLQDNGLYFPELQLDNGAGLSRTSRITARHLAQVLILAKKSDYSPELLASMPIVGIDGTMRRRLRQEPLVGKGRFKTGTLNDVRALAGYITDQQGRNYVVVALHNAKGVQNGSGSRIQDALLRWLYSQT